MNRVGILFSGGPAPAANAVIGAAAMAFRRSGHEVIGLRHGYASLQGYDRSSRPLVPEEDYHVFADRDLWGLRNTRGVFVGTGRANPGKGIRSPADLDDSGKTERLRRVYEALIDLGIEALVSIGGDDTLKTANFLHEFQKRLPEGERRVRIVHVPKTIDNDYRGIDFTFGFFTAVDVMAKELLNLRADAMATNGYFIVETMGRKAGWLAYGVAIAGEAHLVIGVEDVVGDLAVEERVADPDTGAERTETRLSLDRLADRVVDLILAREKRGKGYGTVVLAEGLAEMLPRAHLENVARDEHGHVSLGRVDIGKLVAMVAAERYSQRTGRTKKLTGVQLGYESRCSPPHAFDVMLGSQLGMGAYRALVEKGLDGHMVSVAGQLELQYVPFSELVNPATLETEIRFIERGSDFHRLAAELGTKLASR
ncbi:MAG: 6-phosphofructokinase [Deltaproteobacteria bacterium]|nr:6-phosphofructokinase [Deltaproteobacteria bacterium]